MGSSTAGTSVTSMNANGVPQASTFVQTLVSASKERGSVTASRIVPWEMMRSSASTYFPSSPATPTCEAHWRVEVIPPRVFFTRGRTTTPSMSSKMGRTPIFRTLCTRCTMTLDSS
uniref:Uncharacterized protein n=1 Tax=Cacopsylla melanoneura TaxID=428564 RepID=A0A8D8RHJ2_9HEMI